MIPLGQEDIDLFRTMNVSREIADILNIVREWHRSTGRHSPWMHRDFGLRLKAAAEAQWPTPKPPSAEDLVEKGMAEGKTANEIIYMLVGAEFIPDCTANTVNE